VTEGLMVVELLHHIPLLLGFSLLCIFLMVSHELQA
jgi:hypothetical protein